MGANYRKLVNDMEEGIVVKAVVGDYVIYKKSWLDEHLDQEIVLWRSARDFRRSLPDRKIRIAEILQELKK